MDTVYRLARSSILHSAFEEILMPRFGSHIRPHKGWNPVRRESRIYRAGNVPGSVRRDKEFADKMFRDRISDIR